MYEQVIGPAGDGKSYDESDAQLILNNGEPRFYIMRLPKRHLFFDRITFHRNVTQCLGALAPIKHWYLVVSAPTMDVAKFPTAHDLVAFKIPHGVFVKLNQGTWHAGPLFEDAEYMDFYNLELSDTNVADHNTHVYSVGGPGPSIFEVVDE